MPDTLAQPNKVVYPVLSPRRVCLLAIMAAVPLAVQLVTPIFGDIRLTYANAFLTGQVGSFPENISYFGLMRGFGYKCLYYGLYRAAELVVDSRSPFAFELVTRLIYYSGYLLLSAWFFYLLRGRLVVFGLHWLEAMLLFLIGILATSYHVHQQPEELAILLAVGLTAFSLSDRRGLNVLSGIFVPLMFTCKAVTLWPAVFPFVLVLATRDRGRILRVGASWAVFAAAAVAFHLVVIPQEIANLRDAAMIQGGSCWAPRVLRGCIAMALLSFAEIPICSFAAICFGWFLWQGIDKQQWKEFLLALGAIAIAVPPLIIQTYHQTYHYLQLFPAAFLIALWPLRSTADVGRRGRLVLAMAVVMFGSWMFWTFSGINEHSYIWLWMKAAWRHNTSLQQLDRQFHLSQEPEILYLSKGDSNYVIRAMSDSRYFGHAMLERVKDSESFRGRQREVFQIVLNDALVYRGKYVYLADNIPLEYLPELRAKLKNEYEPVSPLIEEFHPFPDAQLYRRKSTAPK